MDRTTNTTLSAEHCVVPPKPPNWKFISLYIGAPLTLMLVVQVIFGYVIKRLTTFCVIGRIFRKRYKARTIQLYNKLLFWRINGRRLARQRIRYQVERRILQRQAIKDKSRLFNDTFIGNIIDKLFPTGKCLMCEVNYRKADLVECHNRDCPATYCKVCFAEINEECYACLAKEGAVTSLRSQYVPAGKMPYGSGKKAQSEGGKKAGHPDVKGKKDGGNATKPPNEGTKVPPGKGGSQPKPPNPTGGDKKTDRK